MGQSSKNDDICSRTSACQGRHPQRNAALLCEKLIVLVRTAPDRQPTASTHRCQTCLRRGSRAGSKGEVSSILTHLLDPLPHLHKLGARCLSCCFGQRMKASCALVTRAGWVGLPLPRPEPRQPSLHLQCLAHCHSLRGLPLPLGHEQHCQCCSSQCNRQVQE